jgi:hypothetical protein
MAKRKPFKKLPRRAGKSSRSKSTTAAHGLGVRRSADGRAWVLVHPRCARDMAEDIEEVREMISSGELEVAVDELRWLVGSCSEFIEAHTLLGELSLAIAEDIALARGHFGIAVQLGFKALARAKAAAGPLQYSQPANRSFFEAARGLAWCLGTLKLFDKAEELVRSVVKLDHSDPLELQKLVEALQTNGLPMVELLGEFRKGSSPDQAPASDGEAR